MRAFTTRELERMQTAQEDGMMDECELLIRTERSQDEYGMPVVQWVSGSVCACGLENRRSDETLNAEADLFDAQLRLPLDTDLSRVDRLRVTRRFGVLLDQAEEYELVGETQRGPSGLLVNARRVV